VKPVLARSFSEGKLGAEYGGKTGLVEPLLGNGDHGVVNLAAIEIIRIDAVQFQKRQGCAHGRAFVAVDERLILSDVKSVRRRDGGQIALALEMRRLRLHQGGVQQPGFA
jgi:hypothetical protein